MIDIVTLIKKVPEGKKRIYLGDIYINALSSYYSDFIDEDIDLDELIQINFLNILSNKNSLILDLKLFSKDLIDEICESIKNVASIDLVDREIKKLLIEYYNLQIILDVSDNVEVEILSNCSLPLHAFQERIRRKVINQMFRGRKKFLIHMPTGSGKTRTAAEIVIDFIRFSSSSSLLQENNKIIWVAQSSELCIQAFETIKQLYEQKGTKNIAFGHFYGDNELSDDIINSPAIIFCSIQKLMLHFTEGIWDAIRNENYLVVVDEAHRSIASEWVRALDSFVQRDSVNLIGLTATPGAGSKEDQVKNYGLSKYYDNNKISLLDDKYSVIEKPIEFLIEREFLAKIDRFDIESAIEIEDGIIESTNGRIKFKASTLRYLSSNSNRNASIINIIKTHIKKKQKILIFTCGVEHNKILREILNIHGIYSEVIDAGTKNRGTIIDDFKNGDLLVLLNYGVLTTGFDAPKTNVCIIARPIESIVMYSQMVGRILRGPKNGKGNKENTLYTIKDNLKHGDYDELFNSFNNYWN